MKTLVIEDDRFLRELLVESLTYNHYIVDVAIDGEIGYELAILWSYDIIILDIHLPKLDGLSVCRQLRSQGFKVPILILTSHNSPLEIAAGLDAGADDYLVKPYDLNELLARMRALSRRGDGTSVSTVLTWGDICLDPASAQVTYQQQPITLRPKEYGLLELCLRNPQRIFSRNDIIDRLWTSDDCPTNHAVTNLIKDLRQRLKKVGMEEELIETVYGIGYRVNQPKAVVSNGNGATDGDKQAEPTGENEQKGLAAIAAIDRQFRDSLGQRLKVLQTAVQSLQLRQLDADLRITVREEAHRLAGSLGTFGCPKGSTLARKIERLLTGSDQLDNIQARRYSQILVELEQELANFSSVGMAKPLQSDPAPLVLFIGDDVNFADALYIEAIEHHLSLELVEAATVLPWLTKHTPAAIVLTLDPSDSETDSLSLLQVFKQKFSTVPVLTIADLHSPKYSFQQILQHRIQVARLGGDCYLTHPIAPIQVCNEINRLLVRSQKIEVKVMIVTEEPTIYIFLANSLDYAGLQVTCVENSSQFWEVMTTTPPNLLLLDLDISTCSAIDLCQVVRRDPNYHNLPIIVIAACPDCECTQKVFASGANDLIYKPLIEIELIPRIFNWIERSPQQLSRS